MNYIKALTAEKFINNFNAFALGKRRKVKGKSRCESSFSLSNNFSPGK
ncbi:MAG TPA: hypothetical protein VIM16_24640 [Mucilaginibacter sp.]